jgi:hypothetical protein
MKVNEVTGDMKRGDLAFAIEHEIVPGCEAAQQQCAMIGRTVLKHHVFARCELPKGRSGLLKRRLLIR